MPEGLPTDVPTEIPAILGTIVMGLLAMLGWMVRLLTSGASKELADRVKDLEAGQSKAALALQTEETERRLADQKLGGRIQALGKEIRTIHDLVEDAK
jgi:hypothetical protein